MFVLANLEEFMMGVNLKPLVCIMTYWFNGFYKSQKWPFEVWRSHRIWLVILHILCEHIYKKS